MPYLIHRAPFHHGHVADEFEGDVLNWCWMRRFQAEPGCERYHFEPIIYAFDLGEYLSISEDDATWASCSGEDECDFGDEYPCGKCECPAGYRYPGNDKCRVIL